MSLLQDCLEEGLAWRCGERLPDWSEGVLDLIRRLVSGSVQSRPDSITKVASPQRASAAAGAISRQALTVIREVERSDPSAFRRSREAVARKGSCRRHLHEWRLVVSGARFGLLLVSG